jgi:hypothetical protein
MKINYNDDRQSEIRNRDQRTEAEVSTEMSVQPTTEEIANLAYALWQERGCPDGSPDDDWYDAENRLSSSRVEN